MSLSPRKLPEVAEDRSQYLTNGLDLWQAKKTSSSNLCFSS